jgi:hypothetical protein
MSLFPYKFKKIQSDQGAEDFEKEEAEEFLRHESINTSSKSSHARRAFPWFLSAFLALTTLALAVKDIFGEQQLKYFSTDLPDARRSIQYEKRHYTGALSYNYDSKRVIREMDARVEYFGPPSGAIDDAWEDLLRGISTREIMSPLIG